MICSLLFVGSYTFIVQPAGLPSEAESSGLFTMSPENSYLVRTDDNRYELWVDGKYVSTVSAETLKTSLLLSASVCVPAQAAALPSPIAAETSGTVIPNSEETEWYYRVNEDGVLQRRLWSITYQRWLTDWVDVPA